MTPEQQKEEAVRFVNYCYSKHAIFGYDDLKKQYDLWQIAREDNTTEHYFPKEKNTEN